MLGNNNFPWLFNSLACPENTRQGEGLSSGILSLKLHLTQCLLVALASPISDSAVVRELNSFPACCSQACSLSSFHYPSRAALGTRSQPGAAALRPFKWCQCQLLAPGDGCVKTRVSKPSLGGSESHLLYPLQFQNLCFYPHCRVASCPLGTSCGACVG